MPKNTSTRFQNHHILRESFRDYYTELFPRVVLRLSVLYSKTPLTVSGHKTPANQKVLPGCDHKILLRGVFIKFPNFQFSLKTNNADLN